MAHGKGKKMAYGKKAKSKKMSYKKDMSYGGMGPSGPKGTAATPMDIAPTAHMKSQKGSVRKSTGMHKYGTSSSVKKPY